MSGRLLYSLSRTQAVVSHSSAEAEYYGGVSVFVEARLIIRLFRFLGIELKMRHGMDSSGARGIVVRQGVGKIKHLEIKTLWWQDFARGKREGEEVKVHAVKTELNGADIGTKAHSEQRLRYLIKLIGVIRINGDDVSEVQAKLYDKDYLHVGAVTSPEPTVVEKLLFHIGEVVNSMALLARTGMREAPLPRRELRSKGGAKEGWMRESPLQ